MRKLRRTRLLVALSALVVSTTLALLGMQGLTASAAARVGGAGVPPNAVGELDCGDGQYGSVGPGTLGAFAGPVLPNPNC